MGVLVSTVVETVSLFLPRKKQGACFYCGRNSGLVSTTDETRGLFLLRLNLLYNLLYKWSIVSTVVETVSLFLPGKKQGACFYCGRNSGLVSTMEETVGLFLQYCVFPHVAVQEWVILP